MMTKSGDGLRFTATAPLFAVLLDMLPLSQNAVSALQTIW